MRGIKNNIDMHSEYAQKHKRAFVEEGINQEILKVGDKIRIERYGDFVKRTLVGEILDIQKHADGSFGVNFYDFARDGIMLITNQDVTSAYFYFIKQYDPETKYFGKMLRELEEKVEDLIKLNPAFFTENRHEFGQMLNKNIESFNNDLKKYDFVFSLQKDVENIKNEIDSIKNWIKNVLLIWDEKFEEIKRKVM